MKKLITLMTILSGLLISGQMNAKTQVEEVLERGPNAWDTIKLDYSIENLNNVKAINEQIEKLKSLDLDNLVSEVINSYKSDLTTAQQDLTTALADAEKRFKPEALDGLSDAQKNDPKLITILNNQWETLENANKLNTQDSIEDIKNKISNVQNAQPNLATYKSDLKSARESLSQAFILSSDDIVVDEQLQEDSVLKNLVSEKIKTLEGEFKIETNDSLAAIEQKQSDLLTALVEAKKSIKEEYSEQRQNALGKVEEDIKKEVSDLGKVYDESLMQLVPKDATISELASINAQELVKDKTEELKDTQESLEQARKLFEKALAEKKQEFMNALKTAANALGTA